jgi:hypothetical protein
MRGVWLWGQLINDKDAIVAGRENFSLLGKQKLCVFTKILTVNCLR